MTDAQLAALYTLLVVPPLLIVIVVGVVLTILQGLAMHGRRVLPLGFHRVLGWLTLGLLIGLGTQMVSRSLEIWAVVAFITIACLLWGQREGRLPEVGLALVGGGTPWAFSVGLFIVLRPPDPTIGIPDIRFAIVAAALVVIGIGVMLLISGPGRDVAGGPLTPLERVRRFYAELERPTAMGPITTPIALGFLAGLVASTLVAVLARDAAPLPRGLLGSAGLLVVGLGTWYRTTPRRVRDTQTALRWAVEVERRHWLGVLGRPLPRTLGGIQRLVDRIDGRPELRPLRIEILGLAGRLDEARADLALLPTGTPEERATAAEYTEYVDWLSGAPPGWALDRLAAEAEQVGDDARRLQLRVAAAFARAKRAVDAGEPDVLGRLAAVRAEIADAPSYLRLPGSLLVVGIFTVVAIIGPLLASGG